MKQQASKFLQYCKDLTVTEINARSVQDCWYRLEPGKCVLWGCSLTLLHNVSVKGKTKAGIQRQQRVLFAPPLACLLLIFHQPSASHKEYNKLNNIAGGQLTQTVRPSCYTTNHSPYLLCNTYLQYRYERFLWFAVSLQELVEVNMSIGISGKLWVVGIFS